MSPGKLVVMALGIAWLSGWSGGARAQECADDNGCSKGFTCQVTAVSGCTEPAAMPRQACPPGAGGCAADFAPAPPVAPCRTEETRSCAPGPCASDSDCGTGMLCHQRDTGSCSVAPTPPCMGGVCPPAPPPVCTDSVERVCVPRYTLPCAQASDCGEGFSCDAHEQCSCGGTGGSRASGPGSSGAAGAGAPTPSPDPDADAKFVPAPPAASDAGAAEPVPGKPSDCGCKPSAEKYCRPLEITCKVDTECPGEFGCQISVSTPGTSACGPSLPGQDGGVCAERPAPPPVETGRCVPPYYGQDLPLRGGSGGMSGGGSSGDVPVSSPTTPTPGTTNPTPAPPSGTPAEAVEENAEAPASSVEACTVQRVGSGTSGAFGMGALALSLAAVFVRQRRRR